MYVTYTYNDAILLSIQLIFLSDIHVHVNIYSLSLQQCFSPSMQMPVKSNSFTPSPSPSPTRKSFMRWFLFHVPSPFSLFSFFQVKINDIQFLWNHFIKYQMLSHSFNYHIDLENTVYLVLNFFLNFDLIDENCVIPLFRHCIWNKYLHALGAPFYFENFCLRNWRLLFWPKLLTLESTCMAIIWKNRVATWGIMHFWPQN